MKLYFAKHADGLVTDDPRQNDTTVCDSSQGYPNISEALHALEAGSYDIIEERQNATSDDPLSGQLVYSYFPIEAAEAAEMESPARRFANRVLLGVLESC
jgi:hypothetical protein